MNTLKNIGGAFLALCLVVVFVTGLSSPQGQAIWHPLKDAASALIGWIREKGASLVPDGIEGNLGAALGVAAALFAITLMFVPAARNGRAFAIVAVLYVLLGFYLYNPTIFE